MLSRVADSIYWMSRYVERAENVARFVDVNSYLALDAPSGARWEPVIAITGDNELFLSRYGSYNRENVIRFLVFDEQNPNSIRSCLHGARENARSVREAISSEMWEQVNRAYLSVREASAHDVIETPHEFLTTVKQASHLFVGTTYLTMTHNEGWHFGRMGRLIERADKTSRIVDVKCFLLLHSPAEPNSPEEEIQWGALLKSASAFEMYRKRFGLIEPHNVVEFLLFDPQFPRSIYYSVRKAERSLAAIVGAQNRASPDTALEPVRLMRALRERMEKTNTRDVFQSGLHEQLDNVQTQLNEIGSAVYRTFLSLDHVDQQSQSQSQ